MCVGIVLIVLRMADKLVRINLTKNAFYLKVTVLIVLIGILSLILVKQAVMGAVTRAAVNGSPWFCRRHQVCSRFK